MMAARFACNGCGECCRGFGGSNGSGGASKPDDSNNGPIYHFGSVKDRGPPIFGWEAAKLSESDSSFAPTPRAFVYDLETEKPLVVEYNLAREKCGFLDERNRCRVYEKRPLVCRSFPLVKSGLFGGTLEFSRYRCPRAFDPVFDDYMVDRDYAKVVEDAYSEVFRWAVARDCIREWTKTKILDAEREGVVRLLRAKSWQDALAKAKNRPHADLVDYLSDSMPGFSAELKEKTELFHNLEHVKKLLSDFI